MTAISTKALVCAGLVSGAFAAFSAPAMAQTADEPSAPNEITVTARKRNETAQTVADPISVVTAAKIGNADLRTLQDAVRLTPNLVVLDGLYPGYKTVSFRGFTTLGRDGEFPSPPSSTVSSSRARCSSSRTSSTSSRSKSCAVRRARSTAAARSRAPSTS
ncbi:TonB-dependent receptor plug domain-containing protein [Novosphingobium resinovorum]